MFKKIAEDIFNTYMGDSPAERSAVDRVAKWIIIAVVIGGLCVFVGWILGLLF